DRITITDSLDRREVLHTQGEAGLKRVVKKEHADNRIQPGCGDGPHHAHHHAGWQGIGVLL
ncbi:hypothetical protein ACST1Q_RS17110, partial [Escherichia coli]|uniref:hypothetical protein n=1 Tax=Escherichia coli TaxID=562 RepID=UPI0028680C06